MEVELNSGDSEKFFEQIQKLTYSKFQRKLIYNISKIFLFLLLKGTHYIVRSQDLTFIIVFGNHLQILLYIIVFMIGYMLGIYPKLKIQKVQYYSSIIGIILVITYIIKQFEYLIVAKAFFNGIMNCQLTTLRAQLLGDIDSKLYQISNHITSFLCGCSLLYMDKRVVFSLQIFIFIICIARSTYQPPLLGQIDVEDIEAYVMYLEKCANDSTLMIYDDYKNTIPNRTLQSFSLRGKIPGFQEYFQKLIYTKHKQFKFLLSQLLYGFIFYSNLIHLKFYLQDRTQFILCIYFFNQFQSKKQYKRWHNSAKFCDITQHTIKLKCSIRFNSLDSISYQIDRIESQTYHDSIICTVVYFLETAKNF